MTSVPRVHFDRHGAVAVVTLHRPEVRNAIDYETALQVDGLVERIESDPTIEAGVLAATGPVFSSGSDLKAKARRERRPITDVGGFAGFVRWPRTKPFVAAVAGPALGGGFELVLSCEFVVAGEGASFSLPEVRHGIVAGGGGLFRLPRQIPFPLAAQIILSGSALSAHEAHRWGLVNAVVPTDDVRDHAVDLAGSLCGDRALAVRESLRVMRASMHGEEVALWELSEKASARTQGSPQGRRGVQAFATSRRAPS